MNDNVTKPLLRIEGSSGTSILREQSRLISSAVKRLFDIIASLIGLILVSPIFLIIAVLIKRDSPGPVFYRGSRIGKDGKIFGILKFRTMHERAESYNGPRVTAQDDPRITPIGRWLRDTKLNELPQLWNVLTGQMSLVGPRPEDPEIAKDWPPEVRQEILSVRPGITSPASVLYRNEESLLQTDQVMSTYLDSILPSKLRLDQLYVRHRSFWLDLDVILWTILILLPRIGSYAPPEQFLFLGPVSRFFRRYLSWFVIDTLVTFAAMGVTGLFWRSLGPLDVGLPLAVGIALGFALIFSLAGAAFGVNRIAWSNSGALDALDLLPAMGVATLAAYLINYFWGPEPLLPPNLILMASAVAFVGFVLVRYRSRFLGGVMWRWLALRGQAQQARERVLIIGGGEAGQFMSWLLHSHRGSGVFQTVGFVDDDLYKQGTRIQGLRVLGTRADIPDLVEKHDVGILVFAIHNIPAEERRRVLEICAGTKARVLMMPDILSHLNALVDAGAASTAAGERASSPGDRPTYPAGLPGIPAYQLDARLAEVEAAVAAGDLASAGEKIQKLRGEIQASALRTGLKPDSE